MSGLSPVKWPKCPLILPFYRALTRASDGLLRKRAIKFEVELLNTPNFHRIGLI